MTRNLLRSNLQSPCVLLTATGAKIATKSAVKNIAGSAGRFFVRIAGSVGPCIAGMTLVTPLCRIKNSELSFRLSHPYTVEN
jgi:hypothetical protein